MIIYELRKYLFIFVLLLVVSCDSGSANSPSVTEIAGSVTERVDRITAIITKNHALPSPLVDAHFIEVRHGDGRMGPSDFDDYWHLKINIDDIPKWKAVLSPNNSVIRLEYSFPSISCSWWISEDKWKSSEYYDPKLFTGRFNGWIVITLEGDIYMHCYTT